MSRPTEVVRAATCPYKRVSSSALEALRPSACNHISKIEREVAQHSQTWNDKQNLKTKSEKNKILLC